MELITSTLLQGISVIGPFIILLGLLIFVHELGHFSVAKYFGVRVEVFSLGFGKKLLKYKYGDTEYCISMIPLGGYVKMFGDDAKIEVSEEDKKYSFNHKPVSQRIWIVLAGPLMNLIFAFVLFTAISMIGEPKLLPILGDIKSDTLAYQSGFRSGDTILAVNGSKIQKWDELELQIKANSEQRVSFLVNRFSTGMEEKLEATPIVAKNKDILSQDTLVGDIPGLTPMAKASTVGLLDPTSLAGVAGFKTGDHIISVNGTKIERWLDLINALNQQKSQPKFSFVVERGLETSETLDLEIPLADLSSTSSGFEALAQLGLMPSDLFISKVLPDSAAYTAGIREGDLIKSVNSKNITEWEDLVALVRSFDPKERDSLSVSVLRDGTERTYNIQPQKLTQMQPTGKEEDLYAIGVIPFLYNASPKTFLEKTSNPIKALIIGVENSWDWTKKICISFLRLVERRVSPKSIGGPITILKVANETFKIGMAAFFKIMAIISINLFVLNLLPIPILDGGHLVFFLVEALRGAPLSLEKMEKAQSVGLVLILGLTALAFYNDISRLLGF